MDAVPPITLDLTGARCPLPLVGAKRVLDDLPDGRTLVLISDCPGTEGDLRAWAEITGHEVVSSRSLDTRRTAHTLRRCVPAGRSASNRLLDQRNNACPGPILAAKRLLDRMPVGEVLVLLTDCTLAPEDVAVWAEDTAIEHIDTYKTRAGHYEYYLRRRAPVTEKL
ncbi:MAG TPA: sulfurtransferase TusA family protein [Burkholderiaceae bacterium]|nr:sulfurtransferase TusA family protein [Burkholderiaceae bacterium]